MSSNSRDFQGQQPYNHQNSSGVPFISISDNTSFENSSNSFLASPASVYTPDPTVVPHSPFNTPQSYAARDHSATGYHQEIFLGDTPTSATSSNDLIRKDSRTASPAAHDRFIFSPGDVNVTSERQQSSQSSYSQAPMTGLGIRSGKRDSVYSITESLDLGSEYSGEYRSFRADPKQFVEEPSQSIEEFLEEYDSPEKLREQEERREREALERAFHRRSQNPNYFERPLPPPVMIEVPTAQDVRFGIKGAISPGWEDVRRQSIVSQNSTAKTSWRQSIFGGLGPSSSHSDPSELQLNSTSRSKSKAEGAAGEATNFPNASPQLSLSVNEETPRDPAMTLKPSQLRTYSNPRANFVRPISVAPDENLTMMRGHRSDLNNLSPMHFKHSSARTSASSYGATSHDPRSHTNQPILSGQRDHASSEDKFAFLPYDFDIFDSREAETDDALHDPGPLLPRKGNHRMIHDTKEISGPSKFWSGRGWLNAIGLASLALGLLALFAGYPIIDYYIRNPLGTLGAFNLGGVNASGQVPEITGFRGLIDSDTPPEVWSKQGVDGKTYNLVFSDEFNQDGRTFWPGDDPYWEAVDLHYWATNNLEWYDRDQLVTQNGSLVITLDKATDPSQNHGLDYKGSPHVAGLWPAFWTMGNLGRAGYGASLDGLWPYSYDTCDIGTLPNQTDPKTGGPIAVTTMGDPYHGNSLSYLPGQRLSRCTCTATPSSGPNSHPGPKHPDGTWIGRAAPEIDVLEALVEGTTKKGQISQSAQFAPYNAKYKIDNRTDYAKMYHNSFDTVLNPYTGGIYQQAASALSYTDPATYNGSNFASYGVQYAPSSSASPYVTWTQKDETMWTMYEGAVGPDSLSKIGQRLISNEPMYILLNLGLSSSFGAIDFDHLDFPTSMKVDWVRVYQPTDAPANINCSPKDYPTAQYIQDHLPAYTNANLTTWAQYQAQHGDGTGNPKTGFPDQIKPILDGNSIKTSEGLP